MLGTTLEQTPIGALLGTAESTLGVQLPGIVWNAVSATFAANASGAATALILSESALSTWATVEFPILTARGAALAICSSVTKEDRPGVSAVGISL
jgi:hypothetical protein